MDEFYGPKTWRSHGGKISYHHVLISMDYVEPCRMTTLVNSELTGTFIHDADKQCFKVSQYQSELILILRESCALNKWLS